MVANSEVYPLILEDWWEREKQLPDDRRLAVLPQIFVAFDEYSGAQETAMGRQRGRMAGLEDQVAARIDQVGLFLGKSPPEHENHIFVPVGNGFDDIVGKLMPTEIGMGIRLFGQDRQAGIQKQYPLLSPTGQVGREMLRLTAVNTILDFLEDVF